MEVRSCRGATAGILGLVLITGLAGPFLWVLDQKLRARLLRVIEDFGAACALAFALDVVRSGLWDSSRGGSTIVQVAGQRSIGAE